MPALKRPSFWSVALFLTAVAAVARAQTFGNPILGYDEQFYLLVGDRMLHGSVPFVDIFDRKPIGLFLIHMAIRWLGGEGTIQSQFAAVAFVSGTAFAIYRVAERIAPFRGALAAAICYIFWLNLVGGEGGQADVWFNLPMAVAGLIVVRTVTDADSDLVTAGVKAMALVGVALQIKYTAVFEGVFFGFVLLLSGWRRVPAVRLAGMAILWIAVALLPTMVALASYAAMGQLHAFIFANFESIGGKLGDPASVKIKGLALIFMILAPLLAAALSRRPQRNAERLVLAWLAASMGGMLIFGSFARPHYAIPVLVPLTIAASMRLAGRRWMVAMLCLGLVAGQAVLALSTYAKGGRTLARRVADAARPRHGGCLYVYDGYPALYRLTNSCLPSRYLFPGHLNGADEATVAALGVDPAAEVRRILAAKPETITENRPIRAGSNVVTRTLVDAALARHYHLVLVARTGSGRSKLVYRRRALSPPVSPSSRSSQTPRP